MPMIVNDLSTGLVRCPNYNNKEGYLTLGDNGEQVPAFVRDQRRPRTHEQFNEEIQKILSANPMPKARMVAEEPNCPGY